MYALIEVPTEKQIVANCLFGIGPPQKKRGALEVAFFTASNAVSTPGLLMAL